MTFFRFIHTADVHIDSPLVGLTRHEGSAAERIRSATREAFDNLISHAIVEQVAGTLAALAPFRDLPSFLSPRNRVEPDQPSGSAEKQQKERLYNLLW